MKDGWVTKSELEKITGMSAGTIARILRDRKCEWSSDECTTPGGKQMVVLINPLSIPREYLAKYLEYHTGQVKGKPDSNISDYADWQVRTAIERRARLQSIRNKMPDARYQSLLSKNRNQKTIELKKLCRAEKISVATFYRWDKAEKEDGIEALIPGWGKKNGHLKNLETPQKQFLISVYGDQSQPKIAECWRMLVDYSLEKGLPAPSISTTRRFIGDLPENFKALHRKGAKYYQDKHEYYCQRDYESLKSNAIWCSDHHQLNIYVKDRDGRKGFPWFTVWQDLASRKIVGWWLQVRAANSRTIAGAFRHAVLKAGIPERTYVDNGKDYRSRFIGGGADRRKKIPRKLPHSIRDMARNDIGRIDLDMETKGIFMELDVQPIYAWPYHPQSKPTERFFRTLDEQFSKKFEGYRGHNVDNRPEKLQAHIKNGKVMDISELENLLSIYINERYNLAPHKGDGMERRSPNLAWQDKLGTQRALETPAVLDLLMMPVEQKKVGRIGVTLFGKPYYAAELTFYKGREVDVRYDPHDLSKILVFERNGKKICEAVNQERMSWNPSKEDIEKLQKIRKDEKKALKDVYRFAREKVEMPDIRKRIKAGHNTYAGPGGSEDRKKAETEKVKTRFDDDPRGFPPRKSRLPLQSGAYSVTKTRSGGKSGLRDEDVAAINTSTGRASPFPPPGAAPSEDEPCDWKTFADEEEEEDE